MRTDRFFRRRTRAKAQAWATRQANAAALVDWWEEPRCLCGCGELLVRHRNPEKQRLFRAGHDGRLKAMAAGVVAREVGREAIPTVGRALRNRIGFLKTRPELAKAFESR